MYLMSDFLYINKIVIIERMRKISLTEYRVLNGPESYLPPATASMGGVLPDKGYALIERRVVLSILLTDNPLRTGIAKKLLLI